MTDLLKLLGLLALIGGNAFYVIGEYAVVTARRGPLRLRAEAGSKGARSALRLMDDPVAVISTAQVMITALGILAGALGEPVIRGLLGDGVPTGVGFLIAFTSISYVSVVFGELVPKSLTLDRAERLAVVVSPAVELTAKVLRPVVWVLQGSAQVVLRPFGVRDVTAGDAVRSPEELRELVDEAEGSGIIPRAQEELLHNVFDFADREALDVMIPAADVAWLDASATIDEALEAAAVERHSRYPLGDGSLDDIVGIVHVLDLLAGAREDGSRPVTEVGREAMIVPETKDLGALLREFRERREQFCLVLDEYGQTSGIVTLEDVLEEIVGEIEDEYDLPDGTLTWIEDGRVLDVAGSMTIDDFNEALGTRLPTGAGARTLAGLVFDALGRGPVAGDAVEIGATRLAVAEVDGARITRLRVELPGAASV